MGYQIFCFTLNDGIFHHLSSCFYLWSIRKQCYNVFNSNNWYIVWKVSFYFQWRLLNHFPYKWCCRGALFLCDSLFLFVSNHIFQSWFNPVKHFVVKALYWYHLLVLIICTGLPEDLKNPYITVYFSLLHLYSHSQLFFYCVTSVIVSSLLLRIATSRGSSLYWLTCLYLCYLLYISLLMYTTNY